MEMICNILSFLHYNRDLVITSVETFFNGIRLYTDKGRIEITYYKDREDEYDVFIMRNMFGSWNIQDRYVFGQLNKSFARAERA